MGQRRQRKEGRVSEPYNMLCDARYGPMLYNRNDMWMGRSFAEYGEFSEREARMICSALRPGMLAIDAGANIGAFTITTVEERPFRAASNAHDSWL